jgi:hypothetical protein
LIGSHGEFTEGCPGGVPASATPAVASREIRASDAG